MLLKTKLRDTSGICSPHPTKQILWGVSSSQTGEGRYEESGGGWGFSGCGSTWGAVQCLLLSQNQSLNWRASPSPRINWGVLMDSEWIN